MLTNKPATPPNSKNAYHTALTQARTSLETASAKTIAANSGAVFHDEASGPNWQLTFLGQQMRVSQKEGKVYLIDTAEEVTTAETLVILHYLLTAKGTSLTKDWLPYRDLPGGQVYYSTFRKRVNRPLGKTIDVSPTAFFDWLRQKPGNPEQFGDFSYLLKVLPKIPLLFIYWLGDEEMDSEVNVLYDSSASSYLPLEDLVVLAEITTHRLIRGFKMTNENRVSQL